MCGLRRALSRRVRNQSARRCCDSLFRRSGRRLRRGSSPTLKSRVMLEKRKFHRWIGLLASAFLATIAGTGMLMQGHAIWSTYHPALEPVQLPLPAEEIPVLLEKIIVSALDTTNKADHAPSSISISLRMDDGRPRGDVLVSGSASVSQSLSVDPRKGSVFVVKGTLVGKEDEPINWWGLMRNWHEGTVLGAGG